MTLKIDARADANAARRHFDAQRSRHAWADLPFRSAADLQIFASAVPPTIRNVVQLGIGGSALGATTLLSALAPRSVAQSGIVDRRSRRVFVLDNVDPEETAAVLDGCHPRETLYHVVSKSGDTIETMTAFDLAWAKARKVVGKAARRHFVATMSPGGGRLQRVASKEGFVRFEIPPDVGGRFSVLTAVGLLPAALAGVRVQRILDGAADALKREGPGVAWAFARHVTGLEKRGVRTFAVMPYARALREFSAWFVQLWAESLGKQGKGQLPVPAIGATDQHSLLQYLSDGARGTMTFFLRVEKFRSGSAELTRLLNAELEGTRQSLKALGRPTMQITLADLSPETIGRLLVTMETATVFAAEMIGVNPYGQPAVEDSKRRTRAILDL